MSMRGCKKLDYAFLATIIVFTLFYSLLDVKRAHESNYTNWVKFSGNDSAKHDRLFSFISIVMIVLINDINIRIYALTCFYLITIVCLCYINIQCFKKSRETKIIRHTIYSIIVCTLLMILVYFVSYPM